MHLSRRDEHRVMEAMADMSLVTKGQQPARANGDCGVGGARAARVEPEPAKQSMTMSSQLVTSSRASSSSTRGFTVGWTARPSRESDPRLDAPG